MDRTLNYGLNARYFAVPDPLTPGALSYWYVRTKLGAASLQPWPPESMWGIVDLAAVPADALVDAGAKRQWLSERETLLANAVATVEAEIHADLEAAARRFAAQQARCFVCGLPLTDEGSKDDGVGPECRRSVSLRSQFLIGGS